MITMYRSRTPGVFERFAPYFRALNRPALCVWGARDPFVPVAQAYKQRESFPSAGVVVLDDCGHWPWVEDPDGATPPIVNFLRRQATRQAA
jgi:pimeloyl-ACP methyl ester carboxylesterase